MAVFLALATPPMQVADEGAHFQRAVQVGQGGLLAVERPVVMNGLLPDPAVRFAKGFGAVPSDPTARADYFRSTRALRHLHWSDRLVPAFFGNTAIYPPIFYLPAALAIDATRRLGTSLDTSLQAARLAQSLVSLVLATLAIALARRGKVLLMLLLALPMTLSLFASCSQEGPMLATAGLAAAWLSRRDRLAPGSVTGWIGVGLLLGLLGAAKIPSIALGLLPALLGRRCGRRAAGRLATAVALLLSLGWLVFGALPLQGGFQRPGVSPRRQLTLLLAHPLHGVGVAVDTVHVFGATLLRETIGVLGLLDTLLPVSFYAAALLCLFAACGLDAASPFRTGRPDIRSRLAIAAVLVLSVSLIFAIFDLVWTPVGAVLIEGIQGRYLLPPLLFAILLLPRTGDAPLVDRFRLALAGVFLLLLWCVVPATLLARYR